MFVGRFWSDRRGSDVNEVPQEDNLAGRKELAAIVALFVHLGAPAARSFAPGDGVFSPPARPSSASVPRPLQDYQQILSQDGNEL